MISYKSKYEKYKLKYLELKKIIGGVPPKPKPAHIPKPKPAHIQKALINMECFNKKFKEKYNDKKLSLISIINKYEPNYELWDNFIENTFNYIKEQIVLTDEQIELTDEQIELTDEQIELTDKQIALTDEQIIKLLNNYFDIINKRTDEVSRENPNIQILVDTIKQIVDEVLKFIEIYGKDKFYSFLEKYTNFGKNSLEDKYLEIQREKLPTEPTKYLKLCKDIDEHVKRRVASPKTIKERKSLLNFTIPLSEFTYDKQNTLKNSIVNFDNKMPNDLQSALLSLPDKDVYKILEEVIRNGFLLIIDELQNGLGKGAHVIHFLRVKNNLSLLFKGEKKDKLSMPIYVQVMEVGIVKEFLSRIKHLITYNFEILLRKTNHTSLTDRQLKEENLIKKRNHIQIILQMYKHIHNEDLWNFVIILYTINIRTNPELYNDIGLIISFLMVNYPLENSADKAQRIELCQEKLVRYLNYKPKH
jgi:hypothetical protein